MTGARPQSRVKRSLIERIGSLTQTRMLRVWEGLKLLLEVGVSG